MATDDFFRSRLDQMIDLRHPLAVLSRRMPWGQIEAALAPAFARKNRQGNVIESGDLFGTTLEIAGAGVSAAGRFQGVDATGGFCESSSLSASAGVLQSSVWRGRQSVRGSGASVLQVTRRGRTCG